MISEHIKCCKIEAARITEDVLLTFSPIASLILRGTYVHVHVHALGIHTIHIHIIYYCFSGIQFTLTTTQP